MATENLVQSVGQYLFTGEASAYAVLDGASVPDLQENIYQHEPEYYCLFRGELEPDMAEVAPYLVHLDPNSKFTDWVIEKGWGNHWGIFALAQVDIREMRRHFRSFLIVYNTDGRPMRFRYYDPRVMRKFLPSCTTEELSMIFGPVESYLLEDEDSRTALRLSAKSGALRQERLPLVEGEAIQTPA